MACTFDCDYLGVRDACFDLVCLLVGYDLVVGALWYISTVTSTRGPDKCLVHG